VAEEGSVFVLVLVVFMMFVVFVVFVWHVLLPGLIVV
jgi:hypothetical protein